LANLGISNIVTSKYAESLEKRLVRESALEARPGILNQTIQDYECTYLAVGVAILADSLLVLLYAKGPSRYYIQLLANCSCGFSGARRLDADDFDQINDATEIIFFKLLACQSVDLDCDGRIGLPLKVDISIRRALQVSHESTGAYPGDAGGVGVYLLSYRTC
jgi:hypothetical protein